MKLYHALLCVGAKVEGIWLMRYEDCLLGKVIVNKSAVYYFDVYCLGVNHKSSRMAQHVSTYEVMLVTALLCSSPSLKGLERLWLA